MIYEFQRASLLKRIAAFLLDMILVCILATGFCALMALALGFNKSYIPLRDYDKSFEQNGISSITISEKEYDELPVESKQYYDEHIGEVYKLMSQCVSKAFASISIGLFLAILILEFVLPLVFKHGRTVGKKVFGIGVMQISGVKIKPVALFVRAMLGKYAIETMAPLSVFLIYFFVVPNGWLLLIVLALLIGQIVSFFASKKFSFLHDVMASTVNVDLQTQMIFDSVEDLIAYKESQHEESVKNEDY